MGMAKVLKGGTDDIEVAPGTLGAAPSRMRAGGRESKKSKSVSCVRRKRTGGVSVHGLKNSAP